MEREIKENASERERQLEWGANNIYNSSNISQNSKDN